MNTNKIKLYRNIAGLSQDELADKVGISKSMISKYERNIIKPPYEKLKKIADLFGVKVSDLNDDDYNTCNSYTISMVSNENNVPMKQQHMLAALRFISDTKCDLCGKEAPFTDTVQAKNFLKPFCTFFDIDDTAEPKDIAMLCPNCYSFLLMTNDEESLAKLRDIAANRASKYDYEIKLLIDFQKAQNDFQKVQNEFQKTKRKNNPSSNFFKLEYSYPDDVVSDAKLLQNYYIAKLSKKNNK